MEILEILPFLAILVLQFVYQVYKATQKKKQKKKLTDSVKNDGDAYQENSDSSDLGSQQSSLQASASSQNLNKEMLHDESNDLLYKIFGIDPLKKIDGNKQSQPVETSENDYNENSFSYDDQYEEPYGVDEVKPEVSYEYSPSSTPNVDKISSVEEISKVASYREKKKLTPNFGNKTKRTRLRKILNNPDTVKQAFQIKFLLDSPVGLNRNRDSF